MIEVVICCSQLCVLAYLVASDYFSLQRSRLRAEEEARAASVATKPNEALDELQAKVKELHAQFQSFKLGKRQ